MQNYNYAKLPANLHMGEEWFWVRYSGTPCTTALC